MWPRKQNNDLIAGGSRPVLYHSLNELSVAADRLVVLRAVSGSRIIVERGLEFRVATFHNDKAGETNETYEILLPSSGAISSRLLKTRFVAFLSRFTFGDAEVFNRWVVVGDGAGAFVELNPDLQISVFSRIDPDSPDLPTTIDLKDQAWATRLQ